MRTDDDKRWQSVTAEGVRLDGQEQVDYGAVRNQLDESEEEEDYIFNSSEYICL